jgi:Activator of Hsp90 ATPase homolog 1-like protein
MSGLTLTTEGDTHIVVTRRFKAPPEAVYRAHTEPELIRKWLLGPDGWSMPVCLCDARPGGSFRYEWVNEKGNGFHITGEFIALEHFPLNLQHIRNYGSSWRIRRAGRHRAGMRCGSRGFPGSARRLFAAGL